MRSLLRQIPILLLAGVLLSACASTNPYQGMSLDEVFEEGMQSFEEEDWGDAISAFETVLFGAPGAEEAPIARWHMAEAYHRDGQHFTAASEFTRFLERFPTHELAPEAALGVCRALVAISPIVQRDQSDTRRAYRSCAAAASDYPDTPEGQRAAELEERMEEKLAEKLYIGGDFYFRRDLYDSALLYFEDVVDQFPDTEAAPKALRRMYQANREIGYAEEAEEARSRLLEEYPDSEPAREVQERTGNGP